MVLYFTGTGNSRYLARRIAEGLEMPLYDLNACIKAGNTAPVQTGRDVVLVTPTYAWRIPRVVSEWLGKTALTGAERIWFVMDCGSEIGNAAGYNRQLAAQKQLQYMGTAQIIMPENYIAMFNAPQKEQARSIVEQAEPALQKVLTQLRAGQEFPLPRENLYDRFMSGPVNPVFYRFFVKADAFRATDACIKAGNTAPVQTGRDVVLVTPTYAWRIPRVVSEWLGKTELTGAERIWFVMDCGSEIGNAAGYNRQLAAQKQLQYMGTAQIIMPENYIAMFNAPQKEQARSIVEQAEPALQKVLTRLKAGQEFPPPRENLYDRFMSGPVNPVFYRFFVKADAFRATDACIGCGKCVELCPLNNIHLENGKPVWGKNCTHCMACICYCPKEAIEYGKKSKGKPRYHFEALEKQQDV